MKLRVVVATAAAAAAFVSACSSHGSPNLTAASGSNTDTGTPSVSSGAGSVTVTATPNTAANGGNPTGPVAQPDLVCQAFPSDVAPHFFRPLSSTPTENNNGECGYDISNLPPNNIGELTLDVQIADPGSTPISLAENPQTGSAGGTATYVPLAPIGSEAAGVVAKDDSGDVSSEVVWERGNLLFILYYAATDDTRNRVADLAKFARELNQALGS